MNREYVTKSTRIPKYEMENVTIHGIDYKMNNILGSGAFGTVYLATDITNNRLVAIKVIKIKEEEQIENIERELECLKRLEKYCNKYVLCYIDSDFIQIKHKFQNKEYTEDKYIIVTKFLENYISMKLFKKKHPKDSKERMEVATNIRDGLKHIHEQKITHGDIHDENVLVHVGTLDIRFIDFGFCKISPMEKYYKNDISTMEKIVMDDVLEDEDELISFFKPSQK
jgi:serine/threonine protein kinase